MLMLGRGRGGEFCLLVFTGAGRRGALGAGRVYERETKANRAWPGLFIHVDPWTTGKRLGGGTLGANMSDNATLPLPLKLVHTCIVGCQK